MNKVSDLKKQLLKELVSSVGPIFTRKQALSFVKSRGGSVADIRWVLNNKAFRASRGQYDVSSMMGTGSSQSSSSTEAGTGTTTSSPVV